MTLPGDWNDIIDNAEAECFVGREQELNIFRQEITRNPPRYLVYYITGQGGVGKSTLLNRYQEIAKDRSFLLLDADEQQHDVPTVLARFAHQLAELHLPLKRFDERYKVYRQKMNEIENDPEAPQGLAALVSRAVVRTAYIGGDLLPGIRKGLEYFPRESVETQASEWATYLVKKLTNKDEVALLKEPIPILTPLFFEDLNEIAKKQRILLCFENFEATRQELQDWLMKLPEYKPSQNIRLVIAGRDEPGAKWDGLRRVTLTIRLDVFTEQEARLFLDAYGIVDTKRRMEILECSGRLPVLMSWLAVPEGSDSGPTIPTHDIVERFLRWVVEPGLRQVALTAAIPRYFNVDILKLLLGDQGQLADEQTAFEWLQTMPFVQQRPEGWQYHSVVRRMMLHHQRQKSPSAYRHMHTILADFYDMKSQELSSSGNEAWTNDQWRKHKLAYAYHFLVADPTQHWCDIISLFVVAMRKRRSFALEMVDLLSLEDVRNELSHEQNSTVHLFRRTLQAIKEGDSKDEIEMFNELCTISGLSSRAKSYVFSYRGDAYRLNKAWEKALSDFGKALQLLSEDIWAIAHRGQTYQEMGQYREALVDFDGVIALDEKYIWAIWSRGVAYRQLGRYEEALTDFDKVIALDRKHAEAIGSRGRTYQAMGRHEEALTDFDRAIALDEKYAWVIGSRGEMYRQMGRYEEALTDFERAIVLDEKLTWAIAHHGETYRQMGRYEEALVDFERAIALDEKYTWAIGSRGETYRQMGRYEEALTDFERAIALDEKLTWVIGGRGETYRQMGRCEEALTDFERAIALNKKDAKAIAHHGETYRQMGRYEEALTDFERAIALDEKTCAFGHRGEAYRQMGRYEEALTDFDRAITLNEKNAWVIGNRGKTYREMGRYEEALVDFGRAIALDERNTWVVARRGETYRQMGRYEEALTDFDRAIALDEKYAWAIGSRGETYGQMGRYEEALTDFDKAIALGSNGLYNACGLILSYLGRYEEAMKDYEYVLKENLLSFPALYNIAVVMVRWKGFPDAQIYVDKARQALIPLLDTDKRENGLYGLGGLEALANNNEQALDYLQQVVSLGGDAVDWARHDIAWAVLRSTDQKFQSLIFGTATPISPLTPDTTTTY